MIAAYTEGDEPVPGFCLQRLLAWETFGSVWKALGPGGMEAAVKIVSLVNKQRLKEFTALRLVKHIRHPNLVPILAFWLKDRQGNFVDESLVEDGDSLVTEPLDLIMVMGLGDKSLFDRLREYQTHGYPGIPPEELLGYMQDVAHALDHLNQPIHDLGAGPASLQHCDIKPQNILIVGSAAQVCDLGGARRVEEVRQTSAVGSAAYMAPEYITEGKPSRNTDQYSLAICYVELRTGALPLNAKSPAAAYFTHIRGALDLSQLPDGERQVIARATSVRPESRFPTNSAMVQALREACGVLHHRRPPVNGWSAATINILASSNNPQPAPQKVAIEQPPAAPVSPPPPGSAMERVPVAETSLSDESVDLASPRPVGDDDTMAANLSMLSQTPVASAMATPELARTIVVQVKVVETMLTGEEDDLDGWAEPVSTVSKPRSKERLEADDDDGELWLPSETDTPNEEDNVDLETVERLRHGTTPSAMEPTCVDEGQSSIPQLVPPVEEPVLAPTRKKVPRRYLPLPVAVVSAALIGLLGAWLARSPASGDGLNASEDFSRPGSQPAESSTSPSQSAETREEVRPPQTTLPPVPVHPFVLVRSGLGFDTLAAALERAQDGDKITVHENGPFFIESLEWHGKAISIQAAPGCSPVIQLASGPGSPMWRSLFASDRALTIDGLELRRDGDAFSGMSGATFYPAPLVVMEQAPLTLRNCRLLVPQGSTPVRCRNPGRVELRHCQLVAESHGLCVETGDGTPCEIDLIGNSMRLSGANAAAILLWAPEVRRPAPVRLLLEQNNIRSARICAFDALPDLVKVHAHHNEFTFREALLSYAGFAGVDGWRRCTRWQEEDNLYHATGDWLKINGISPGIRDYEGWKRLWSQIASN